MTAYTEHSLAWLVVRWRTPTAHENAAITGFPSSAVGLAPSPNLPRLSDEKRSWVAAAALFSLAVGGAAVAIPRSVVELDEHDLRARIHGTVLWAGVVRERIGIKVAADTVADMQEQLAQASKALSWARVQRLLDNVPLDAMQVFWPWAADQGRDGYILEPDWAAGVLRGRISHHWVC